MTVALRSFDRQKAEQKNAIINISTAIAVQAGILWFISVARSENLFGQVLANGAVAVILSIPFCVPAF